MRQLLLRARPVLDAGATGRLCGHALGALSAPVIGGFWPMAGEIDVRGLLHVLAGRGQVVALPCVVGRGPLLFRRWWPGAAMRPGPFGTSEPVGEAVVPEALLVPLLAFDRRGGRLGYGGGYYDRTLAARAVRTLGCAAAIQEVDAVPREPWDLRLDRVVTEDGLIEMECR